MELDGFWVFITIIIISTAFIFIMTRNEEENTEDEQTPEQITE